MANRYPEYRLLKPQVYELTTRTEMYSRRLAAGATCRYFAHSDTYLFASREGIVPFFDGETVENSPDVFEPVGYYIFLGGMADFGRSNGDSLLDCAGGKTVVWTAAKTTKPDDVVFFYITAPMSALVASGKVIGEVWKNEDVRSDWEGYWMAEIGEIKHFGSDKRIPIKRLREVFDEWRWLRMPRQNQRIPNDLVKPFLEMVGGK